MSIDYLAKLNAHSRDKNITFKDEGHIYNVCGETDFTSVTTWIHSFVENFDADQIITNMMSSKNWKSSKYYGKTRGQIKAIWDENRINASTAGTKLHYDIECVYNQMEVKNDSIKKMSYLLNSFFKRQMVINYIYNHPDRVIRFYRMHNKIYVRFNIYDDINFNETTEWCVNYHIGEIEIQKYQDILDANITGITNFSVTGFEKRMKDSKINLGLNIGIKIYE